MCLSHHLFRVVPNHAQRPAHHSLSLAAGGVGETGRAEETRQGKREEGGGKRGQYGTEKGGRAKWVAKVSRTYKLAVTLSQLLSLSLSLMHTHDICNSRHFFIFYVCRRPSLGVNRNGGWARRGEGRRV